MIIFNYDNESHTGTLVDDLENPQYKLLVCGSPKTYTNYTSRFEFERDFNEGLLTRMFELAKVPFVDPPPFVPEKITPRQARIALALREPTSDGFPHLLAQVESAFETLPEPDKTIAKIAWEYSTEILRGDPLVLQMQEVLGFSSEKIDELFIQASTI